MEPKTERQLLEEISLKLDKIFGSLAIAGKGQSDQVRILRSLDLEWNVIGMMVGLTADAARMRANPAVEGRAKGPAKARNNKTKKGGT